MHYRLLGWHLPPFLLHQVSYFHGPTYLIPIHEKNKKSLFCNFMFMICINTNNKKILKSNDAL